MLNFIIESINNNLNISWTIIIALFGIFIKIRYDEVKSFRAAADTFRSKVITELEGIYPITRQWWDESHFPKFQQSVPKIETAAVEFGHFIPKRKSELNTAVKNYHDYCQQRKYEKASLWDAFPNSPKHPNYSGIHPVEEFKNIVEHLLSLANEK